MHLTDDHARAARYCVSETVRRRLLAGIPVPAWLRTLDHHLARSVDGPETEVVQQQSKLSDQPIDTAEAAAIIGCTDRHIRRIAADLDGQRIAGRWIFHRPNVTDYAEARNTP
jgi:hypothetical protein